MNNLINRSELAANMLKNILEECGLYLAVDVKTQDFLFIDRESYEKNDGKFARIPMIEINVK